MKVQKRRWLHRLVFLLVLLAAVGSIVWWLHSRIPGLETYQAKIERAITSQEYGQALNFCNQALEAYPGEGSLYEQKAEIYYAQGETDLAIRILDYGYKQTGLENLLELRDSYDDTDEPDVVFHSAQVASPDLLEENMEEQEDGETGDNIQPGETQDDKPKEDPEEVYCPYVLPQVSLPHVDPPEPSPKEETPDEEPSGGNEPSEEQADGDVPGEEIPDQEPSDEETANEETGDPEAPTENTQQGGEAQTGVPQEEADGGVIYTEGT